MIFPMLVCMVSFLGFASLCILLGSRIMDEPELFSMLWSKYRTTLLVVASIVVPVVAGPVVFGLSVTAMALISHNEVSRLSLPGLDFRQRVLSLAGTLVIMAAGAVWGGIGLMAGLVLTAAVFLLLLCARKDSTDLWTIYGRTMTTLVYPTGFWGFYFLTYQLPFGPALILFFYSVTESNNAFAQLVGSMMGKTKMFPGISPNKTWEGMIGGAAAAVAAGISLNAAALHFAVSDALAGSILIVLGATAGDLIASKIKRHFSVKDFGSVLPNHGGIMDMMDSLVFTAPFFFWFAAYYLNLTG